jgi:hypothetical protein
MIAESTDVRRRVLRAVNQDGLLDATMGFALLAVALYVHLSRFFPDEIGGLGAILPMLIIFSLRGLRARLTYPRIGYANPRTRGITLAAAIALLVLTLAGVAVALLTEFTAFRITPRYIRFLPLAVGIGVAAWAVAMAVRTRFRRFYPYAGLLVVALAAGYGLRLRTSLLFIIPLGLAGTLMIVLGIIALVRFLRTNPAQPGTTADDA